jgi:hypothetical protein
MMKTCAHDIVFFLVDYFGEVIRVRGKNPSGQGMTVIVNSVANSVYCRMAWVLLHPKYSADMSLSEKIGLCSQYRDHVELVTYGDDNDNAVQEGVEWFNHTAIKHAMASFGVTYTNADKTNDDRTYESIEEITFLKREFRYDPDLKRIVAPLAESSLMKNLQLRNKSDSLSEEQHLVSKLRETQEGFFFHGREKFEFWTERLRGYAAELNLLDLLNLQPFLTWDELVERYRGSEERVEKWNQYMRTRYELQSLTTSLEIGVQLGGTFALLIMYCVRVFDMLRIWCVLHTLSREFSHLRFPYVRDRMSVEAMWKVVSSLGLFLTWMIALPYCDLFGTAALCILRYLWCVLWRKMLREFRFAQRHCLVFPFWYFGRGREEHQIPADEVRQAVGVSSYES